MLATLALADGVIPPTTNVDEVDAAVEVDVVRSPRLQPVETAVVNAFGFGGHNVSLVLTHA